MKKTVQEGSTIIYTENPLTSQENSSNQADVFYNKVQVFNRDISLLATLTYIKQESKVAHKQFRFLDALTASGLRAL